MAYHDLGLAAHFAASDLRSGHFYILQRSKCPRVFFFTLLITAVVQAGCRYDELPKQEMNKQTHGCICHVSDAAIKIMTAKEEEVIVKAPLQK